MQKYKYAIFDMDGTLLDSLKDLRNATNHVMELYGYPVFSLEEIRQMVGHGNRKLMEEALPEGAKDPDFEKKFDEFKKYYTENCMVETKPYDGILMLLQHLKEKNIPVSIVSNKIDDAVVELSDHYFGDLIFVAIGMKPGMRTKPAPDSTNEALALMKADRNETLYIGDSDVDAETAENAKLDYVLVSWGFRDKDVLMKKHPLEIVDRAFELWKFFD